MKSAAIGGVLSLCAMVGTIHAAEIPNMVGTWKPSGGSAGGGGLVTRMPVGPHLQSPY